MTPLQVLPPMVPAFLIWGPPTRSTASPRTLMYFWMMGSLVIWLKLVRERGHPPPGQLAGQQGIPGAHRRGAGAALPHRGGQESGRCSGMSSQYKLIRCTIIVLGEDHVHRTAGGGDVHGVSHGVLDVVAGAVLVALPGDQDGGLDLVRPEVHPPGGEV